MHMQMRTLALQDLKQRSAQEAQGRDRRICRATCCQTEGHLSHSRDYNLKDLARQR